jgi:predicted Ser/Thr protein kinase
MISDRAVDRLQELLRDSPAGGGEGRGEGRYELLTTLGHGGMGTVYLAHDTILDREVALKVLEPGGDEAIAARLAQEARILGRLEHPGIVPVHDCGRLADGRLFYAMKRVRGERLDRWMADADLHTRLGVFVRICEAVSFAHAHQVIHRDLKPENVMIGEFGEVLVLDWGIARVLDRLDADSPPAQRPPLTPSINTAHGTVVGTPAYMAPEQARGEVSAIDQRTDIYALGAMLATLTATADSGALAAIATKARADRPDDRYQSAQDLAADISRFVAGLAVRARREPIVDRIARLATRYRTPLLLILTYLLARLFLFWAFRV